MHHLGWQDHTIKAPWGEMRWLSVISWSWNAQTHRDVRETIALGSALEDEGRIICQSCSGITVKFFQSRGRLQTVLRSAEGFGLAHTATLRTNAVRNGWCAFMIKTPSEIQLKQLSPWSEEAVLCSDASRGGIVANRAGWFKVRNSLYKQFHLFLAVRILNTLMALSTGYRHVSTVL